MIKNYTPEQLALQQERRAARRNTPSTQDQFYALLRVARKTLSDASPEEIIAASAIYSEWAADTQYIVGDIVAFGVDRDLYKAKQAHRSQAHYTPDMIPAIWTVISDGSKGSTKDSPIKAARGMEYVKDLYYYDPEDGKTYICTRDGVLQYLPHELIGHYFSLA